MPNKAPAKKGNGDKHRTPPRPQASKGGNSNKGGHKLGNRYGSYGGYKGVSVKKAGRLVDSQIRKSIAPERKKAREVRRNYRNEVSGINKIASETQGYLTANNQKTQDAYSAANSEMESQNQALLNNIADSGRNIQDAASSELSRLGITDPNSVGKVSSSTQNALNIAGITGTNNIANLAAQQAGAKSIGDLMLGMNRGTRDMGLNAARNDRRDALSEINDAIREARGTRYDLLLQTLEQLRQTGWGQYMDQQNLNLQRDQFNFQKAQARAAAAGGSGGGSGGGGGGGSYGGHSSGGGSGSSGGTEYSAVNNALTGALGGKKKGKKKHRGLSPYATAVAVTGGKYPHLPGMDFV